MTRIKTAIAAIAIISASTLPASALEKASSQPLNRELLSASLCLASSEYLYEKFQTEEWKNEVQKRRAELNASESDTRAREQTLRQVRQAFSKKNLKAAIKGNNRYKELGVEEVGMITARSGQRYCASSGAQ